MAAVTSFDHSGILVDQRRAGGIDPAPDTAAASAATVAASIRVTAGGPAGPAIATTAADQSTRVAALAGPHKEGSISTATAPAAAIPRPPVASFLPGPQSVNQCRCGAAD